MPRQSGALSSSSCLGGNVCVKSQQASLEQILYHPRKRANLLKFAQVTIQEHRPHYRSRNPSLAHRCLDSLLRQSWSHPDPPCSEYEVMECRKYMKIWHQFHQMRPNVRICWGGSGATLSLPSVPLAWLQSSRCEWQTQPLWTCSRVRLHCPRMPGWEMQF